MSQKLSRLDEIRLELAMLKQSVYHLKRLAEVCDEYLTKLGSLTRVGVVIKLVAVCKEADRLLYEEQLALTDEISSLLPTNEYP